MSRPQNPEAVRTASPNADRVDERHAKMPGTLQLLPAARTLCEQVVELHDLVAEL